VISLIYGIGILLAPTFVGPLYGFGNSPAEILLGRFFGAALLGIGLINWLAREADYVSLRPIILGNLIADVVGLLVCVMGTLSGVMNSLGWFSVALYLLLSLGFGYLQFMGQPVNARQHA
jgi:hypothetical protein